MTWLRLEDGFAENEKISELSDRSFRLHVAVLCYCGRGPTRMSYGAQVCRAHHRLPLVDPFYGGEL